MGGHRSGWRWAGWTGFLGWQRAGMNRIAMMGMGGDRSERDGLGWGWTGLPGWGWAGMDNICKDGQDCWDGDGPGWTGLPRWGWVGLHRIARIGIGGDMSGWGWAGMDRIVWMGMGLDRQDCLDGVGMRKVGPDCRDGDWQ